MKNKRKSRPPKGFSLVELLVVISVIGVIAAIAIPAMSGIFGESETAKAKRNAQQIASVFSAAQNAGNTTAYADKNAAVTAVTQGSGMPGRGAFSTSVFHAPMSTTEADLAKPYLSFNDSVDSLNYIADGGETSVASAPAPNNNPWEFYTVMPNSMVDAEINALKTFQPGYNWRSVPYISNISAIEKEIK